MSKIKLEHIDNLRRGKNLELRLVREVFLIICFSTSKYSMKKL